MCLNFFIRSYLSPRYPAVKLPGIAPRATRDPIHELSSPLIGDPKGPPSFSKLGRTGLVHPNIAPVATIHRLPVIVLNFQDAFLCVNIEIYRDKIISLNIQLVFVVVTNVSLISRTFNDPLNPIIKHIVNPQLSYLKPTYILIAILSPRWDLIKYPSSLNLNLYYKLRREISTSKMIYMYPRISVVH